MKYAKREKLRTQIALAAMLMGAFTTQPAMGIELFGYKLVAAESADSTKADATKEVEATDSGRAPATTAPAVLAEDLGLPSLPVKEDVSADELKNIVQDFEIWKDGTTIRYAGLIPARCATDFKAGYGYEAGQHRVSFKIPACANGFKREPNEVMVDLMDVDPKQGKIAMQDQDGEIVLVRESGRSRGSRNPLATDQIMSKGEEVHESAASLQAKAEEEEAQALERERVDAAAAEAKRELDEIMSLEKRIDRFCKNGDVESLEEELLGATSILGDVTEYLTDLEEKKRELLVADLEDAESASEAKEAYEALIAAVMAAGLDEAEVKQKYIEKRIELAKDSITGAEKNFTKAAKEIEKLHRELRSLVVGTEDKKKSEARKEFDHEVAVLYGELAVAVASKNDLASAAVYLAKANKLSPESKAKNDKFMMERYMAQFKACLEKNKLNPGACDKFAAKVDEFAKSMGETLTASASTGDEEAAEALAQFNADYIQTFGAGLSVKVNGLGQVSQQPGLLQQMKTQAYQQGIMEQQLQQQEMLRRQMMGQQNQMMGPQMMTPAATGGGFFR